MDAADAEQRLRDGLAVMCSGGVPGGSQGLTEGAKRKTTATPPAEENSGHQGPQEARHSGVYQIVGDSRSAGKGKAMGFWTRDKPGEHSEEI